MAEGNSSGYPDELREECEAALIIARLKYAKIPDEETFKTLQELKQRNNIDQIPPIVLSQPSPTEEYAPSLIPPVPSLRLAIGRCSMPFEKQLTESDVREDQSRVSLSKEDVERFLIPLLIDGECLEEGIPVTAYDKDGNEFPMTFKIWSGKTYVLNGGWKRFCASLKLIKLQDFITVWMFRHVQTKKLCFVITSRRSLVTEALHRRKIRKIIK